MTVPPPPARREPAVGRKTYAKVLLIASVLSVLLVLPSLTKDFLWDDYIGIAVLEHDPPCMSRPLDLFRYSSGVPAEVERVVHAGFFPWWTNPHFKFALLRPLASALGVAQHALFGRNVVGYRIHSVLWFLGSLVVVSRLYFRTLPIPLAVTALLLFAIDDAHYWPITWVSNCHALVSTLPAVAGLLAYLRWREDGWRPGRWLALVALAIALSAGEVGVQFFAYFAAYELAGATDGWRQRLRASAPVFALLFAYLVLYRLLDRGVAASASYLDLVLEYRRAPLFVARMFTLLVADLFGGLPAIPVMRPIVGIGLFFAAVTAALLPGALAAMAPERARRVRWMLLGAILAIVPSLGTMAMSRLLMASSVGVTPAIAAILHHTWQMTRGKLTTGALRRVAYGAGLAAVGFVHVIAAPTIALIPFDAFDPLVMGSERAWALRESPAVTVVVLLAPPVVESTAPFSYSVRRLIPGAHHGVWPVVSAAPFAHRLVRIDPSTIEIEPIGGVLLRSPTEAGYRHPADPMHVGQVVETEHFRVEVLAMAGPYPTRIRVRFDRPLDDPSLHLIAWGTNGYQQVIPPSTGSQVLDYTENKEW